MAKYVNYFIVSKNAPQTEVAINFKQVSHSHICSIDSSNGNINVTSASEIKDVANIVMNRHDAEALLQSLKDTLAK